MTDAYVWAVILGLGLATYLIRFSFLGIIGDRALPPLALTLLRYVPAAVLPALVAPLVFRPIEAGAGADPARVAAAGLALAVGVLTRSLFGAIAAGMLGLWALRAAGL